MANSAHNTFLIEVQIPEHSTPIKYEMHHGSLFVERFLQTTMRYPCHVATIINQDNQPAFPLQVILLAPTRLIKGCRLSARALGKLLLSKNNSDCSKVLMVPSNDLTEHYAHINTFADLHPQVLDQLAYFFTHYEDGVETNVVQCEGWVDFNEDLEAIMPQRSATA